MKAGRVVKTLLLLPGFKNTKSKVIGSRNSYKTVKAVLQALNAVSCQRLGDPSIHSKLPRKSLPSNTAGRFNLHHSSLRSCTFNKPLLADGNPFSSASSLQQRSLLPRI